MTKRVFGKEGKGSDAVYFIPRYVNVKVYDKGSQLWMIFTISVCFFFSVSLENCFIRCGTRYLQGK